MKKIRLDAESLEVLSFTTAPHPESRGTVQGAQTGYTCYETVGWLNTQCLAYAVSYWGEETCGCLPVEDTDPRVCPQIDTDPRVCPQIDTADLTCMTCPGQAGC